MRAAFAAHPQRKASTMSEKTENKGREQDERNTGKRSGENAHSENSRDKTSKRLDEALEETFPSSDPVSVKITK